LLFHFFGSIQLVSWKNLNLLLHDCCADQQLEKLPEKLGMPSMMQVCFPPAIKKIKVKKTMKRLAATVKITAVKIGTKIGEGHFGKVFNGFMDGFFLLSINCVLCFDDFRLFICLGKTPIALKLLDNNVDEEGIISDSTMTALLKEAEVLRDCSSHPNIVKFYGIYKASPPPSNNNPYYIVTELMDGNIRNYLMTRKNRITIGVIELLQIAIDAATGMNHLASNGIIHRDLAGLYC